MSRSSGGRLKGLYLREAKHGGGTEPYAPLAMFKLMLLGPWYGLPDTSLAYALTVQLDFMVIAGFEPGDRSLSDATTICRFRNRRVTAKRDEVLLRGGDVQLEGQGLKVAGSRGAIIDATIIESAADPNQHVEVDDAGQADMVDSADGKTRCVKKGEDAFRLLQLQRCGHRARLC